MHGFFFSQALLFFQGLKLTKKYLLFLYIVFTWGLSSCTQNTNDTKKALETVPALNPKKENDSSLYKIVFLGDSLTEGYGVSIESAYPKQVENLLNAKEKKVEVINSGISGSTTASAPDRISWVMKSKPDMIVIALGANDGLRGVSVKASEENLSRAIEMIQKENSKIKIVLAGMMLPMNYGEDYRTKFAAIFPHLVEKYHLASIPFLLKDVGGEAKLNQEDGIHPNEEGHKIIAKNIFPILKEIVDESR